MTLQKLWTRGAIYVLLVAFAAYYMVPIAMLIMTSLKGFTEINVAWMWKTTQEPTLEGIFRGWTAVSNNFVTSLEITIPAAIISSFIGSINGYIFAKWKFRGANTLFLLFLVGMFLPYQGILIPLVQVLKPLGLYGNLAGVIFTHVVFGIPITAMMFRSYFAGVPSELVDAAKIDGCGFFGIYRHIMLPIAFPAFAVVMIWQFTNIWNDYLISVVVLSNPRIAPVNVAVKNVAGSFSTEWNVQMAAALIAALPTIVVYLALGKFFMRGLLAGSVKG